jgi:hypothetical protein
MGVKRRYSNPLALRGISWPLRIRTAACAFVFVLVAHGDRVVSYPPVRQPPIRCV